MASAIKFALTALASNPSGNVDFLIDFWGLPCVRVVARSETRGGDPSAPRGDVAGASKRARVVPMPTAHDVARDTSLWQPLLEGCKVALFNGMAERATLGKDRDFCVKCVPESIGVGFIIAVATIVDTAYKVQQMSNYVRYRVALTSAADVAFFLRGELLPKPATQEGLSFGHTRLVKSKGSLRFVVFPLIFEYRLGRAEYGKCEMHMLSRFWEARVGANMVSVERGFEGSKYQKEQYIELVDAAKHEVSTWPAAATSHLAPLLKAWAAAPTVAPAAL